LLGSGGSWNDDSTVELGLSCQLRRHADEGEQISRKQAIPSATEEQISVTLPGTG